LSAPCDEQHEEAIMSKKSGICFIAVVFAICANAHAVPFTSLTIFGDSSSDTGNAYIGLGGTLAFPPFPPGSTTTPPFPLIPSAPYPRGTLLPALTNGPTWAEVLGASLGLPVLPSFLGGTNYAFGGADSGPLPSVPPSTSPSLLTQFNGPAAPPASPFFGGGPIDPNALYAVWGGGNDIRRSLDVYFAALTATGDPAAALAAASAVVSAGVGNIASILTAIAAGGGKHILSINVPDAGLAPAADFLPPGSGALATGLSAAFNAGLAGAIDGIEAAFALDVLELDAFTLLEDIVASPASFGLANATDPCLQIGGAGICADPEAFFFLDGIHPTAAGHRIIGLAALAAIPNPATVWLLALGSMLLLASRWIGRPVGAARSAALRRAQQARSMRIASLARRQRAGAR
jgi:phospholipase/lecithinase/hemolysin